MSNESENWLLYFEARKPVGHAMSTERLSSMHFRINSLIKTDLPKGNKHTIIRISSPLNNYIPLSAYFMDTVSFANYQSNADINI